MIDPRLAWFAIGATCSAVVFGWPWHPRFSRFNRMGPPKGSYGPRLDPGIVQRGNGHGGPTTAKPRIIPRGTRSISYPDPGPDRQPTNPFTGDPVKPQPHGGPDHPRRHPMTDIDAREVAFRAAIEAASLSFDRGISTAAEMIREAARNERFLAALRHDPAPALAQLAAAIESTNEPTP